MADVLAGVTAGSTAGLRSAVYELDDLFAVQEHFHSRGWTDGLPVMPPTPEAVQACLDWTGHVPDQVLGVEPVRNRPILAEKVAVNAVMAGCLPVHFPVVVAAVEAMLEPEFLVHGATSSTGGCAVLVVVNGPVRRELGMDATFNVLGNTDRASGVIGRAVRLFLINVLGVRPGEIDRSTLGHPGKYSYCIAEDEEGLPEGWAPLGQERGAAPDAPGSVTVFAAMGPRQLLNEWTTDPADIAETFAADIRNNLNTYSFWPGNYAVVVPTQLRQVFADAGWTKDDLRRRIFERARITRGDWRAVGKGAKVYDSNADREHPALPDPSALLVIGAGGPAGGFGAVIPPWLGHKSRAVTRAIGVCDNC